MVCRVDWTVKALKDLHDIYDFIAKDSKKYAQLQVENIQSAVTNASAFPQMGRKVPEFPNLPYREIIVGNYRALYRFEEEQKRVLVLAIVHGRQSIQQHLKEKG